MFSLYKSAFQITLRRMPNRPEPASLQALLTFTPALLDPGSTRSRPVGSKAAHAAEAGIRNVIRCRLPSDGTNPLCEVCPFAFRWSQQRCFASKLTLSSHEAGTVPTGGRGSRILPGEDPFEIPTFREVRSGHTTRRRAHPSPCNPRRQGTYSRRSGPETVEGVVLR